LPAANLDAAAAVRAHGAARHTYNRALRSLVKRIVDSLDFVNIKNVGNRRKAKHLRATTVE
jgi:hypothetical protein